MRRNVIVRCAALFLTAAFAISLCMTRKYEGRAQLEFNPQNSAAVDMAMETAPPAEEYAVTLATQAAVLQSDTLALQVIDQLILAQKQPSPFFTKADDSLPLVQSPSRRARLLKQFHNRLSVAPLGGTRILEVRFRDPDPALAAAVANTLVNDYLEQYFQTRYSASRQASTWLSDQLGELRNEVTTSQQRLAEYQKQTGILGESETNNVVMAKLEDINKQLSSAEANRIIKQAVWQLVKTGDPELISSMAGSSFVQGVSTGANSSALGLLPTLRAQEAQLKAEIAETSARLGPSFPKLIQMRSQLADLQLSIESEIRKIAARAENDYLAAKSAEDMERALFDHQKVEANRLNDSAVQYGVLKREAEASRDLYETLLGKLKQAGVLAGLRSSNIIIIDPARTPTKPSSPNYPLNLALGLAAGLVSGMGFALIQDSTDTTLRTPADIARSLPFPVLGVLTRQPDPPNVPELEEQFRVLRTSLSANQQHPRVLLVTSPLPREGKTTVSIGLARSLAQQGERVLLVDADLRRPSVHRVLASKAAPGLSAFLTGDCNTPSIEALDDGLHLLVAGTTPSHPAEMLGSKRMTDLLQLWRTNFEWIVIDTPPVLSVTDAAVLARQADGVLLVVRSAETTADSLLRTSEILGYGGAKLYGTALNAMDRNSAAYSHYFGHPYAAKQLQEYIPS